MATMTGDQRRREAEELASLLMDKHGLTLRAAVQLATAALDQMLATQREYHRDQAVAYMEEHVHRFKQ